MYMRLGILTLALATVVGAAPSGPEKPDMPPDALAKTATHVVVGKVEQIWSRVEDKDSWETTRYVAEIRVEKAEKGDGLAAGELVYARYWHRVWDGFGQMPTDTVGHRGLPEPGQRVRVYLARDAYDGFGEAKDGGFNVIGANGFAKL